MDLINILQNVELFFGLNESEISELLNLCHQRHYHSGQAIITQGDQGGELYIITDGFVEVQLDKNQHGEMITVVTLGIGQIFGEMALVDKGLRSATVRAGEEPTVVQVIRRQAFEQLCEKNNHIGFVVMRNIASDLSFKLRHLNLRERGM
jgi:CRP/FNR family cyclic AMP-dependent transcriptional regulator